MFGLEMSSESELYMNGCKGIIACTEDSIMLNMGNFDITIRGDNITMLSYTNGEIYIDGKIISIVFEYRGDVENEK